MRSTSAAVAMAYTGTVIGAGFASGQEIWQFFSRFGYWGGWGIGLACLGFMVIGRLALERGRGGTREFGALLASAYPPWAAAVGEGLTAAFLAIGIVVVVAGGGAALSYFGIAPLAGKLLTLVLVVGIATRGGRAVTAANSAVVPYLILVTLSVALFYPARPQVLPHLPLSPPWALSAVLYVSYNLFTAVMVLLALGPRLPSGRATWRAAGLAAGLLGLLAFAEHSVLLRLPQIGDLPLLAAAHSIHAGLGALFAASLWLALMTTGIGGAFALGQRFGKSRLWWLLLTIFLTPLSFKTLVGLLYPVMGSLAVLLWLPLFITPTRRE